jgi:mRNA-degrading endonuclease RelE of RelBE toxin-antitoxin system
LDAYQRRGETVCKSNKSSRRYPIRKLKSVLAGEGQYRLRSGRFRFRYDIADDEVVLLYCGLRKEDTY